MTPDPNPTPDPTDPPATDPPAIPPVTDPPATDPPAVDPPAQETTDWKAESRKWEQRAKDNVAKAQEYDKLEEASKSELQRAQDAAQRSDAQVAEMRNEIASAKIEAALAGIVDDPSAVVADLNVAKFLDANGAVDAEAVKALRERYEAFAPPGNGPRTPQPTPGQGANTQPAAGQLTREALKTMSPAEIVAAQAAGQLNDVLGVKQ